MEISIHIDLNTSDKGYVIDDSSKIELSHSSDPVFNDSKYDGVFYEDKIIELNDLPTLHIS